MPANCARQSPWAEDKRAAEIVRPAPVQAADSVPPKSLARDMAFAKLQWRILSAAEAVQAAKLHSEMPPRITGHHAQCGRTWQWHVLDGHAQITDRAGTEGAVEDGHGATARCYAGCRSTLHARSASGQQWGRVRAVPGDASVPLFFAACMGEPELDRTARSSALCAGSSSRQEVLRAMSLSSTIG